MANRVHFVAANWKMYKSSAEAVAFAKAIIPLLKDASGVKAAICPPFTALGELAKALKGSGIGLGAQNLHWEKQGAFTGEVSAGQLKEVGCTHVIIGHSERRRLFGETDASVNKKLKAALQEGLVPIVCVGETLEEREAGKTESVVKIQLEGALAGISSNSLSTLVIAYEPVWAIGTGKVASPQQAQEVHLFIRTTLRKIVGNLADMVPIQYGGSVKPDNIAELMKCPDVDGALVGGASLEPASFAAIVSGAA